MEENVVRNLVRATRSRLKTDYFNAFISTTDPSAITRDGLRESNKLGADYRFRPALGALRLKGRLKLLAVKDNISTTQLPTTCASGILQGYQSPFEAHVVERLCDNDGCLIVGKTNMDEFGMGSHSLNSFSSPVINGSSLTRDTTQALSAGGSSGGSAVAVQVGQAFTALGTDTGGSVRLPAAYTGQCGFKPSYGRVSRWGVIPYANSLDTVGFFGRSVADVYPVYRKASMPDDRDPSCISSATRIRSLSLRSRQRKKARNTKTGAKEDLSELKIGVPVEYNIEELDPAVRTAWKKVLEILKEQGCKIVPVSLPMTKHALSAYYVIAAAEAMSNLAKYDGVRYGSRTGPSDNAGDVLYSETRGQGFGNEARRRILLGSYTLSSEAIDNYFLKAQKVRRLVQRDFDRVLKFSNPLRNEQQFDISDLDESIPMDNKLGPSQVDYIVCPTAPTLPPKIQDVLKQTPIHSYMNDVFTVPASLAGLPAISIPVPTDIKYDGSDLHMPAGIQLIGQYLDDNSLCKFALDLEGLIKQAFNPVDPGYRYVHHGLQDARGSDDIVQVCKPGYRPRSVVRYPATLKPRIGRMTVFSRVIKQKELENFARTEPATSNLASPNPEEVDDLFASTIDTWEQRHMRLSSTTTDAPSQTPAGDPSLSITTNDPTQK
ncbi:glutamyl-tRNA(Gln) amidotransferase subunit A [Coleophoma crateriformis]|uniref:Glutamyl-tRNA(Gln) amidotransferase subunit A, mitochondrial n=1 Tax=Coleophoma crateriformis TaxID=565419 RepID=A0A3D8QYQ1_9HELO|nr:glutamyl-tRNA(Gln) amidotransferase subunit A [Coleophoma crateriformis]